MPAVKMVKEIICKTLQKHEWTLIDSTAIARKSFMTAVGPKEALVYLWDCGPKEDLLRLSGDYQSQGSNILEAHSVLIPKAAGPEAVALFTEQFVANAEAAIAESYAARLYIKYGYKA